MRVEYALVTGAAPRLKGLIPPTPVITPGGGIALAGRRVSRRFAWWATNLFN